MVYFRTRPEFRSGTGSGGIWLVPVPVPIDLAGTRPVQIFFFMLYLGFMMSYLHHVPPPVLWLDHVHPSSSQTVSRATLQFPDCITCSPPVPRLYHVLPSSSQNVSCPRPPPPPPIWRHLERNIIFIFTVCYFY